MAHDIYFIRDALIFLEFEQGVSYADAGRVLRVLKYWCFAFHGAGQHNYTQECADILLQWKYETTTAMRSVLERLWFVNRLGKPGRWIAADLYLEHLNYWVKVCSPHIDGNKHLPQFQRVFIASGNGVTVEYIINKGSAPVEAF